MNYLNFNSNQQNQDGGMDQEATNILYALLLSICMVGFTIFGFILAVLSPFILLYWFIMWMAK